MPGAPTEHLFDRIPGTGIWYRTYLFRDDARFMYMLSVNDPLTQVRHGGVDFGHFRAWPEQK
jgi:hypothetical protein